jgi:bis(5'-nucleosidyl)-tetraphosphatase
MELVFSAGIVPVKKGSRDYEYLMLRSGDYYDFPKGKLDPGETHLEAAIRETREESGLSRLKFKWGRVFQETDSYKTKMDGRSVRKVSRYYLGEVSPKSQAYIPRNPETGIKEHQELRWVTYDEALKLPLHTRIKTILDWARSQIEEKKDVEGV